MARVADLRYNLAFSVTGEDDLQRVHTLAQSIAADQRLIAEETKKSGIQTRTQTAAVKDGNISLKEYIQSLYRLRDTQRAGTKDYIATTRLITGVTNAMRVADQVTQRHNSTLIANQKREANRVESIKRATESSELLNQKSKALIQSVSNEGAISVRSRDQYEKLNREYERSIRSMTKLSQVIGMTKQQKAKIIAETTKLRTAQANLNNTFDKSIIDFKDLGSQISSLSSKMRLLDSNVRTETVSMDQATIQIEEFKMSIDAAEQELKAFAASGKFSADQITRMRNDLATARQVYVQTSRDIKGIANAFTGTTKASNSANQLMLSFGDIAQDSAQFSFGFAQGMRAIGNNITFAAEQFQILSLKAADANGGVQTLGNTMKFLKSSLMGAGGLLLGINLLVTFITMWSERQRRLSKDIEETKDRMDDLYSSLKQFRAGDIEFDLTDQMLLSVKSLQAFDDQIKTINKSIFDLSSQVAPSIAGVRIAQDLQPSLDIIRSGLEKVSVVRQDLIDQYPKLLNLDDKQIKKFLELKQEQLDLQQIREAEIDFFKKSVDGGADYIRLFDSIQGVTDNLKLAEAQREVGIKDVVITQDQALKQLGALRSEMLAAGLPTSMLTSLTHKLAEAYSDLGGFIETIDPQKRLDIERRLLDSLEGLLETEFAQFVRIEEAKRVEAQKTAMLRIKYERFYLADNKKVYSEFNSIREAFLGKNDDDQQESDNKRMESMRAIFMASAQFTSALTQLGASQTKQNEKQARKQFETNKKLAYASAIINGAAAVVDVYRSQKGGPVAKAIAASLIGAAVGIQIAKIRQQQFSYSGSEGGDAGVGGGGFGFQMNEIQGPQTFRTPGYMPSQPATTVAPNVDVQIMANRRDLYAMVRMGEEETNATQVQ